MEKCQKMLYLEHAALKKMALQVFLLPFLDVFFLGQKKLLADVTLAIIYKCLHTQHFSFFYGIFFFKHSLLYRT